MPDGPMTHENSAGNEQFHNSKLNWIVGETPNDYINRIKAEYNNPIVKDALDIINICTQINLVGESVADNKHHKQVSKETEEEFFTPRSIKTALKAKKRYETPADPIGYAALVEEQSKEMTPIERDSKLKDIGYELYYLRGLKDNDKLEGYENMGVKTVGELRKRHAELRGKDIDILMGPDFGNSKLRAKSHILDLQPDKLSEVRLAYEKLHSIFDAMATNAEADSFFKANQITNGANYQIDEIVLGKEIAQAKLDKQLKEKFYVDFAVSTVFLDSPYKYMKKVLKKNGKRIFPGQFESVVQNLQILISGLNEKMPSAYNVSRNIYSQLEKATENQYCKS